MTNGKEILHSLLQYFPLLQKKYGKTPRQKTNLHKAVSVQNHTFLQFPKGKIHKQRL